MAESTKKGVSRNDTGGLMEVSLKTNMDLSGSNAYNKGFELADVRSILQSEVYAGLRDLVNDMTQKNLATSNRGSLAASNLTDSSGRHLRHTINYIRAWEYVRLIALPELHLKRDRKILCLGEGSSPIMFFLAGLGHEVAVVDLEEELIANTNHVAEKLDLPITAVVGDMTQLEFPDDSFDYIVSTSVIEHLTAEHKQAALGEMGRIVRAGGLICLSFDYGTYIGDPKTGEAHDAIAFDEFDELLIKPSKCRPFGPLNKEAENPLVLKKPYWRLFNYWPGRSNIIKGFFYQQLPYSFYTLFLEKQSP